MEECPRQGEVLTCACERFKAQPINGMEGPNELQTVAGQCMFLQRFGPEKRRIMADISSISGAGPAANVAMPRISRPEADRSSPTAADQVEISDLARLPSALEPEEQTRIRAQKVADIREAIANGTYETPDKIDYVVGRLMQVLRAAPEAVKD